MLYTNTHQNYAKNNYIIYYYKILYNYKIQRIIISLFILKYHFTIEIVKSIGTEQLIFSDIFCSRHLGKLQHIDFLKVIKPVKLYLNRTFLILTLNTLLCLLR